MNPDPLRSPVKPLFPPEEGTTPAASGLSPVRRLARTAFWTLCVCAYSSALWGTIVVLNGNLLPISQPQFGGPVEASFASYLCWRASLVLIPLTIYFRRTRAYVWTGLGPWAFQLLFFSSPEY